MQGFWSSGGLGILWRRIGWGLAEYYTMFLHAYTSIGFLDIASQLQEDGRMIDEISYHR
jgi:hypothetical protein